MLVLYRQPENVHLYMKKSIFSSRVAALHNRHKNKHPLLRELKMSTAVMMCGVSRGVLLGNS